MLENELSALLPAIKDTTEAVKIYESFDNYKNEQLEFGVISIGFKLK